MKLVYYLRYYPTLTETFVYREAAELMARGHHLRCVAIGERSDGGLNTDLPDWEAQLPPNYAMVSSASARMLARSGGREAARWLQAHQPRKQVAKALWAASTLQPDEGIHVHFAGEAAEWALAAHIALGVDYTVTVHAVDLFRPRPSLGEVLKRARRVLTVSAHNASEIRERYGVHAEVVHCGIDPDQWLAADPSGDGPVVSVGRWVPKKGLDLLVDAVTAIPELNLVLVGTAPPEIAGPRVANLGALPRQGIAEVLQRSSLFALPCRIAPNGDRDGIPVSMMEAMAAGLPILTTDLPGLGELVSADCGWRIPPDDPAALIRALKEAWANPAMRAEKGAAARARVCEGFTIGLQAEGVLEAWSG